MKTKEDIIFSYLGLEGILKKYGCYEPVLNAMDDYAKQETNNQICDGCNVKEPWEHRCHGSKCNCDGLICKQKQGRMTHSEALGLIKNNQQ